MRRAWMLTLALVVLGSKLLASDVGVSGSCTRYPSKIEANVAGKAVKMTITGTALRRRSVFNVYAVASYVLQDSKLASAEELAAADVAKRLHLVMERTVDGK